MPNLSKATIALQLWFKSILYLPAAACGTPYNMTENETHSESCHEDRAPDQVTLIETL